MQCYSKANFSIKNQLKTAVFGIDHGIFECEYACLLGQRDFRQNQAIQQLFLYKFYISPRWLHFVIARLLLALNFKQLQNTSSSFFLFLTSFIITIVIDMQPSKSLFRFNAKRGLLLSDYLHGIAKNVEIINSSSRLVL